MGIFRSNTVDEKLKQFKEKIIKDNPLKNKRVIKNDILEWRINNWNDLQKIESTDDYYFGTYRWKLTIDKLNQLDNSVHLYIKNVDVHYESLLHIYSKITIYLCNFKDYWIYKKFPTFDNYFSNKKDFAEEIIPISVFMSCVNEYNKRIFDNNNVVILVYIQTCEYNNKDYINELSRIVPTDSFISYSTNFEKLINIKEFSEKENKISFKAEGYEWEIQEIPTFCNDGSSSLSFKLQNKDIKEDKAIHICVKSIFYFQNKNELSKFLIRGDPNRYFYLNKDFYIQYDDIVNTNILYNIIEKPDILKNEEQNQTKNKDNEDNSEIKFGVFIWIYEYNENCFMEEVRVLNALENVEEENFFNFNIDNWKLISNNNWKSSEFLFANHKWCLELYPNGIDEKYKEFVSVELKALDFEDNNKEPICIDFVIYIRNSDDFSRFCSKKSAISQYIDNTKKVITIKNFNVIQNLFKNENERKPVIENFKCVFGIYMAKKYKFDEDGYRVQKVLNSINKDIYLYPNFYHEWKIENWKNLSNNEYSEKFRINNYVWRLVFYPNGYYNGNKTYICTGIQNLDIENDNSIEVLAKFIIVLYNYNDNSLIYSKEAIKLFNKEKPVWGFSEFISKEEISKVNKDFNKPLLENNKIVIGFYIYEYDKNDIEKELDDNTIVPLNVNDQTEKYTFEKNEWKEIHLACKYNDIKKVEILIKNKVNINEKTKDGWTALHIACQYSSLEIVEILINNGADINIINDNLNALEIACINNFCDKVDFLISKGAKINSEYKLMHIAAYNKSVEMVKTLVKNNIDPDVKNEDGWTALGIAIRDNCYELAEYLIKKCNADVIVKNNKGDTPLHIACQFDNVKIIDILLSKSNTVNVQLSTQNDFGWAPIHVACQYDNSNIIISLINMYGTNINCKTGIVKDRKELEYKTGRQIVDDHTYDNQIIESSMKELSILDQSTPLQIAVYYNNKGVVDTLLNYNNPEPDVKFKNKVGLTALDIAYKFNYEEIITSIKNYIINKKNDKVNEYMMFIEMNNQYKEIYFNNRAELLINAVKGGKSVQEIINIINSNINLENVDKNGWTALHWASYLGYYEIVGLLIDNNAKIDRTTIEGLNFNDQLKYKTAKELAQIRKCTNVVNLINSKVIKRSVNNTITVFANGVSFVAGMI